MTSTLYLNSNNNTHQRHCHNSLKSSSNRTYRNEQNKNLLNKVSETNEYTPKSQTSSGYLCSFNNFFFTINH